MAKFVESEVEDAALAWLAGLGWTVAPWPEHRSRCAGRRAGRLRRGRAGAAASRCAGPAQSRASRFDLRRQPSASWFGRACDPSRRCLSGSGPISHGTGYRGGRRIPRSRRYSGQTATQAHIRRHSRSRCRAADGRDGVIDGLLTGADQMEGLSLVYARALAVRAGYSVSVPQPDRDSVDLRIQAGGAYRPASDLQLKAARPEQHG